MPNVQGHFIYLCRVTNSAGDESGFKIGLTSDVDRRTKEFDELVRHWRVGYQARLVEFLAHRAVRAAGYEPLHGLSREAFDVPVEVAVDIVERCIEQARTTGLLELEHHCRAPMNFRERAMIARDHLAVRRQHCEHVKYWLRHHGQMRKPSY